MSHSGYRRKSLEFLTKNKIEIGDLVKVQTDSTYSGILMPRYEHSDDDHIVLKLKNGYNIGLQIEKIIKIEVELHPSVKKENTVQPQTDPKLPKILLISTGGTIASKIDYRTGGVYPALTAAELNASVSELSEIANIDTEVLFSEYSENLLPEHWIKIAEKLNSYSRSEYKGIIVSSRYRHYAIYSSSTLIFIIRVPKTCSFGRFTKIFRPTFFRRCTKSHFSS